MLVKTREDPETCQVSCSSPPSGPRYETQAWLLLLSVLLHRALVTTGELISSELLILECEAVGKQGVIYQAGVPQAGAPHLLSAQPLTLCPPLAAYTTVRPPWFPDRC